MRRGLLRKGWQVPGYLETVEFDILEDSLKDWTSVLMDGDTNPISIQTAGIIEYHDNYYIPIFKFAGPFRFLSNFYPTSVAGVSGIGIFYPSAEHAYQAAKTLDFNEQRVIARAPSPGTAKRLGRMVTLRPDWEQMKVQVMRQVLRNKFSDSHLRQRLLKTGETCLIEGNNWGDTFWGKVDGGHGIGRNMLGRLLMELRRNLWGEVTA